MNSRREELWKRAEATLTNLVNTMSTQIDEKNLAILRDFIDNREYQVALEWLHSIVKERSLELSPGNKDEMLRLAHSMNISLD
jgi:hypothetical protein